MTDSFALHVDEQGLAADEAQLMAAIAQAIARGADHASIGCFAATEAQWAACARALRELGCAGELTWVASSRPQDLERFGTLFLPGPGIDAPAWRRLGVGERRYSLCGVLHATASHAAMSTVANYLAAPLRSWDAVICTSRVVRDSVRELLERQADYLRVRLGAQRFELPQLPWIPPGLHCEDFAFDQARRADARRELGIDEGHVAFLATGHPHQIFSALGRANAGGRRLHLILQGSFTLDASEEALRQACALLCPGVRLALCGDAPDAGAAALAAADVFTALSDDVQDGAGRGLLAAMAAGLPCLASDWGGNRDAVRDGVDGYLIPTVMPAAGAGLDLAQRYDDGVDGMDLYCGHISQAVALDGAALALACERLLANAELRRQLGANARARARGEFDSQLVFGRYAALWRELGERRRADAALGPALPQGAPDRPDPFALFARYPSAQITPASLVELTPDASLAQLRAYRALAINRYAASSLPTLEEFGQIFGSIESRPMQVDELLDTLGPCDRPTLLRGLAWLCKMDLLRIAAEEKNGAASG